MKPFVRRQEGTVSVYLIVIIVPIFLFHAVLIDYARVKIAEREIEAAHRAANRSVFAQFDKQLQTYGLFGTAENKAANTEMFRSVLEYNLSPSLDSNSFRYIDTALEQEGSRIQPLFTVANHVIFKQQLLQEMKYKAPVEFAKRIIEPFKNTGASQGLEQTSRFYENAEKLEKLLNEWHVALDKAWEESVSYTNLASRLYGKYSGKLGDIHELAERIGLNTVESVRKSIEDIEQQIRDAQQSIQSLNRQEDSIQSTIAALIMAGGENAEALRALSESLSETRKSIRDINQSINDFMQRKVELEQLLKDVIAYAALVLTSQQSLAGDQLALAEAHQRLQERLDKAQQINDQLRKEKENLQSSGPGEPGESSQVFDYIPVYNLEFFSVYRAESAQILVQFQWLQRTWQDTALFTGDNYNQLVEGLANYNKQINVFLTEQQSKEQERQQLKAQVDSSQKEQKQKVEGALDEAKKVLGSCGLWGSEDQYTRHYQKLGNGMAENAGGLYAKYYNYNSDEPPTPPAAAELGEADKSIKQAMSFAKQISNLLTGFRDELYMNEYALTKFNYRTAEVEKTSSGQPPAAIEPSRPLEHPLKNQEAEYILYGFNSCASNYSAAYGEMFVFFLAIRTVEALQTPDKALLNLGSPVLVFLAAAAQGAMGALADMNKLLQGESVPVLKKFRKFTVNYKDMLRIFYLLHSNDAKVMSRMQALIELNTGIDLTEQMTYMQSSASASVRLWFMPGAMRVMNGLGFLNCENKNNRCQITKTAVMSY